MRKFYTVISWLAILLLWCCAASVYVSPAEWGKIFSLPGLCFPFCAMLVIAVAALGLLAKSKLTVIPLAGLLFCCGSLRDYCPINLSSPPPKGCLKVLSYNTMSFASWKTNEKGDPEVAVYICAQKPDIAALQEAAYQKESRRDTLYSYFKQRGYHYETALLPTAPLALASRWPIVRNEVVVHEGGNSAVAFYVVPNPHDTLIVVNVHLESMHLTKEERNNYHEIVRNPQNTEKVPGKRKLLDKIASAGVKRALQADTLATFLDRHSRQKIILMGDFNDTPISYAHHSICSRLTDTYRATGNGIGRTFNRDAICVRIDNIFCSAHYKPFAATVDPAANISDHHPIMAFLYPQAP